MVLSPRPLGEGQGEGGRTLVYDAWNRLVKVLDSDGVTPLAAYQYDGRNFRVIQRSYTAGTLSEVRHFYYTSDWQVVEERVEAAPLPNPESLTLAAQYVWGLPYVDDLVCRNRDTNADATLDERLYALHDANWNVVALAATTGAIAERYTYAPYGQVTYRDSDWFEYEVQDSAYSNTVLYTGRTLDPATSLYDYRARYYDPALERFVSRDPIGYRGGMNLYEYVGDSPVAKRDPYGLEQYPSPNMTRYLAYRCGATCGKGSNVVAADTLLEANTLAGAATFQYIDAGWINEDEFNPGRNTLNPNGAPHAALRHCIASGLLAKRTTCKCSACVGDRRELFQYLYGSLGFGTDRQPKDVTSRTLYNNAQGRLCAGCKGNSGSDDPVDVDWVFMGEGCYSKREKRYPLTPEQDIIDCCKKKLAWGDLALPGRYFSDHKLANDLLGTLPLQPTPGTHYQEGNGQSFYLWLAGFFVAIPAYEK